MLILLLLSESLPETNPVTPFVLSGEPRLDFTWLFMKVMFALLVVCLIAFVVLKYVLPRASFVRRAADSDVEIIERFTLEPKKNLYILKVATKYLLVGTTENSIRSLLELDAKEISREKPRKED